VVAKVVERPPSTKTVGHQKKRKKRERRKAQAASVRAKGQNRGKRHCKTLRLLEGAVHTEGEKAGKKKLQRGKKKEGGTPKT